MGVHEACGELSRLETPDNKFLLEIPKLKRRLAKGGSGQPALECLGGSKEEVSLMVRQKFYQPSQSEQEEDELNAAEFIKDATRKRKKPTDPIPPVPHPKPSTFPRSLPADHEGLVKGMEEEGGLIAELQPKLDLYHQKLTADTDAIAHRYELLDGSPVKASKELAETLAKLTKAPAVPPEVVVTDVIGWAMEEEPAKPSEPVPIADSREAIAYALNQASRMRAGVGRMKDFIGGTAFDDVVATEEVEVEVADEGAAKADGDDDDDDDDDDDGEEYFEVKSGKVERRFAKLVLEGEEGEVATTKVAELILKLPFVVAADKAKASFAGDALGRMAEAPAAPLRNRCVSPSSQHTAAPLTQPLAHRPNLGAYARRTLTLAQALMLTLAFTATVAITAMPGMVPAPSPPPHAHHRN